MLTLQDGRTELWQWDTGRALTVDAECSQVHFSNKVFGRSIDVDVIEGLAAIPDILLQTDNELNVWAFVGTAENGYTKISKTFKVNRRNKPADYVFTPPDQTSIEEIKERLEYLEQNPVVPDLSNYATKDEIPDVSGFATKAEIPVVPKALPNPNALTFTGAVNATYDGSTAVSVEIPSGGSGGLSADEKTLLLTLLKNAKYAENVQPAYEQLEVLFNSGAIVTYTVTNNLTNLTTDNEAATITAGFPYKATLADADGTKPKSVEVVMGGVDVSGEYYADGVIDIPSVSGELVITAFAKNTYPVIYSLANTPVTCNADLYEDTGLEFGSESADGYTKSWTMVVKVKNVSAGYLWCVNGQKALSSYYENRWNSDAGDKVMTINTYICSARVSSGITQANPEEVCIVITKEALSPKTATVHYLSWAGEYVADTVTGTYAQFSSSAYAANMMIGGQTGADFVGTIEGFVIYEGIMQEDEIKAVLGV